MTSLSSNSYPSNNYQVDGGVITPTAGYLGTLVVPVTLADGLDASDTATVSITIYHLATGDTITGIDQPGLTDYFSWYPNPASDHLTLEQKQPGSSFQVTVFSLSGAQLLHQTFQQPRVRLDLSKVPAGIYRLHISSENFVGVKSLIIARP